MKFMSTIGIVTAALALGLGISSSFAAPLDAGSNDVQVRRSVEDDVIPNMFSRSLALSDEEDTLLTRAVDDLLEYYTLRSLAKSDNLLLERSLLADEGANLHSRDYTDIDARETLVHFGRSDEFEDPTSLFTREQEEGIIEARNKIGQKIGNFFKKIWHGIKKVVSAVIRRDVVDGHGAGEPQPSHHQHHTREEGVQGRARN